MRASASNIAVITCVFLLLLSPACRKKSVPLVEYENVAISSGSGKALGLEDIRKAVAVAAAQSTADWQLTNVESGRATATLRQRNDIVEVQITYTETMLSILGADGRTNVNPKYNKLVAAFLKAIQRELAKL